MKAYLRYLLLLVVVAAVLLVVYAVRQATEPESAIIARERNNLVASRDESRAGKDPFYERDLQRKLDFLNFRLAVAYNAEQKPDKALEVLQRLIDKEEEKEKSGLPRRARSYTNEADYYEALKTSFDLKHDEAEANRALERRMQLLTKAAELSRLENREEGRTVGPAD